MGVMKNQLSLIVQSQLIDISSSLILTIKAGSSQVDEWDGETTSVKGHCQMQIRIDYKSLRGCENYLLLYSTGVWNVARIAICRDDSFDVRGLIKGRVNHTTGYNINRTITFISSTCLIISWSSGVRWPGLGGEVSG